MIRTCNLCGVGSDQADFYAGVTSRCKECHKREVRKNRAANVEYYRAYDAKRFQEQPQRRAGNDRYATTLDGKASCAAAKAKWALENPEKRAAHHALKNAIRSGSIEKPKECSRCGNIPRRRDLHGHHEDYEKPLEVEWICAKCHTGEHKPYWEDFEPRGKKQPKPNMKPRRKFT